GPRAAPPPGAGSAPRRPWPGPPCGARGAATASRSAPRRRCGPGAAGRCGPCGPSSPGPPLPSRRWTVPDPLLSDDQLVGEWDADARLHTVTGWVAGPAGSAGVELPGVELDVDVAEPIRTCQLMVEAPAAGDPAALPDATRAALLRLLGPVRTAALLELAAGDAGHPARLPGPAGEGPPDSVSRPAAARHLHEAAYSSRRRIGPGGVAPRLARLGLARLRA